MDSSRQACSRAAREHSAALAWRLSLAPRRVSVSQCYCFFGHFDFFYYHYFFCYYCCFYFCLGCCYLD
jgi:hypothetical protein